MSVAVNETYTKNGECVENTEWYRCIAYRRIAEITGEYGDEGKEVLIRGKMKTRSYEKDGETEHVTELVVHELQLRGGHDSGGQTDAPGPARQPAARQQAGYGGASKAHPTSWIWTTESRFDMATYYNEIDPYAAQ